jgi:hypothetical protein
LCLHWTTFGTLEFELRLERRFWPATEASAYGSLPIKNKLAVIAPLKGAGADAAVRGEVNRIATENAICTLEPGTQFFILRFKR